MTKTQPLDSVKLLQELIAIPGPPGKEDAVRAAIERHVSSLGLKSQVDAKGNLTVNLGKSSSPKIVVTAHMDEIAMIVRRVEMDGRLSVDALGGLYPWKLGEGPVQIMCTDPIDGILSFGSIHTEDEASSVRLAEANGLEWGLASVFTGMDYEELDAAGVRPGTRVVVHPSRRGLRFIGDFVAGYFLDDRADVAAWLLALESLRESEMDVLFAATTCEEVGGEGAKYLLHKIRPEICIALELGPCVDDAPVELCDQPTVWVHDSYASMAAADVDFIAELGQGLGMELQFQALSRGGSDASASAGEGLCARPITLGIPMENSHGFEIIHPKGVDELARLTIEVVRSLGC